MAQANREALKAQQVNLGHIGEDFSIVQTVDYVVSFTQTDQEQQHKLARLWVDKSRAGVQQFGAVLSQNYQHGQFVMQSTALDREDYVELLEQLVNVRR